MNLKGKAQGSRHHNVTDMAKNGLYGAAPENPMIQSDGCQSHFLLTRSECDRPASQQTTLILTRVSPSFRRFPMIKKYLPGGRGSKRQVDGGFSRRTGNWFTTSKVPRGCNLQREKSFRYDSFSSWCFSSGNTNVMQRLDSGMGFSVFGVSIPLGPALPSDMGNQFPSE